MEKDTAQMSPASHREIPWLHYSAIRLAVLAVPHFKASKMKKPSTKTTQMMLAWQSDANQLGLPEDVQKGLLFLLGFGVMHVISPGDKIDWLRYTQKLSAKISLEPPHIPDGEGEDFYDIEIKSLLAEFIYMVDKDFSPRVIEYSGTTIRCWERSAKRKLPRHADGELASLRDWEEVMISLCRQIGEYINMDLEGAYLAGFVFFDSCVCSDLLSTMKIANAVTLLPPQFQWLRMMLDHTPEEIASWGPVIKVRDAFACGDLENTQEVYLSARNYLRFMRAASGKSMWDGPLQEFADVAIQIRPYGKVDIASERWLGNTKKRFLSGNWSTPPSCRSKDEVLQTVYNAIKKGWGFDCIHEDPSRMLRGSLLLRKCAFVYTCATLTVLNPKWNPLAVQIQ